MLSAPAFRFLSHRQKLVRLRVKAQLRWYRRVARSQHLWQRCLKERHHQPRLATTLWVIDEWTGRRERWSYERALHLEEQAYILYNRLRTQR
jgi:hypothetical protein